MTGRETSCDGPRAAADLGGSHGLIRGEREIVFAHGHDDLSSASRHLCQCRLWGTAKGCRQGGAPCVIGVEASGSKTRVCHVTGSVRAVNVGNDQRPGRDVNTTDVVILERDAVDHPERRVESQRLVDHAHGAFQLVQVAKIHRILADDRCDFFPDLEDVLRVPGQQIEDPGQRVRRCLVAGPSLKAFDQRLRLAHRLAGVVVTRLVRSRRNPCRPPPCSRRA